MTQINPVYSIGDMDKQRWESNGKLHREDGPAIIYNDGTKLWYINGELHREDGPAIIDNDGYKVWYINGKRHREDGPAVIGNNGYKAWYINSREYSFKVYCEELKLSQEQILKLTLKYNL